jgi:hypothetical protein
MADRRTLINELVGDGLDRPVDLFMSQYPNNDNIKCKDAMLRVSTPNLTPHSPNLLFFFPFLDNSLNKYYN